VTIRFGGERVKRKPAAPRRNTASSRPLLKRRREERRAPGVSGTPELGASKPRPRSVAVRLAGEVERLAAELELFRARIAELEARVDIDPLTETLNRRGFERELTRSLAYVKRYEASAALIYIDLDRFKPVNDRFGHAAGDAVLKAIAAALLQQVRASDLVARLGGDEFVVLLWNVSGAVAAAKALALEAAISAARPRFANATLTVGASAGVALLRPLDSAADVLSRADAAMYARKAERQAGLVRR